MGFAPVGQENKLGHGKTDVSHPIPEKKKDQSDSNREVHKTLLKQSDSSERNITGRAKLDIQYFFCFFASFVQLKLNEISHAYGCFDMFLFQSQTFKIKMFSLILNTYECSDGRQYTYYILSIVSIVIICIKNAF